MKRNTAWLLAAALMGGVCAAALADSDLPELRRRMAAYYEQTTDQRHVGQWLQGQREDGSWQDIDYDDRWLSGGWSPREHLSRLRGLAAAWRNSLGPHHDSPRVRDAVLKGLDFWFAKNPVCEDNWWFMSIGRNLEMGRLVVMMGDALSPQQIEAARQELYYPITGPDEHGEYVYRTPGSTNAMTGQNLAWVAEIHMDGACMLGDEVQVAYAARLLGSELRVTSAEGINPDYSYHLHGPQIQNAHYGLAFALSSAMWMDLFSGLSYGFDQQQIEVLRDFYLEGEQWMIRRGFWDPLVLGRAFVRPNATRVTSSVTTALEQLIRNDSEHQSEYRAFIDHIHGRSDASLVGHKHFWRSDYMVHRRAGYSLHWRGCSTRTYQLEGIVHENVQNMYQSQGATFIMVDGAEYDRIFPCLRYDLFPGVTAPAKNPAPGVNGPGATDFVGGVTNGTYGVAALDQNCDGATGHRSWFCFDDEIVCLGADLRYDGEEPLRTSLNQCLRRSDVSAGFSDGTRRAIPVAADQYIPDALWVYHDHIGYVAHDPGLIISNELQVAGDWHGPNPARFPEPTPESHDRFTLWIDHGRKPDGATYAYTLLPAQTEQFVADYAQSPAAHVIANTREVQAVRQEKLGVCGIVFWQAGSLLIREGVTVQVDRPCLVLVDESGSVATVSVSRYDDQPVTLIWREAGSGRSHVIPFQLPGDAMAGQSVTRPLPAEGGSGN